MSGPDVLTGATLSITHLSKGVERVEESRGE